jgi:hypothetical protein
MTLCQDPIDGKGWHSELTKTPEENENDNYQPIPSSHTAQLQVCPCHAGQAGGDDAC